MRRRLHSGAALGFLLEGAAALALSGAALAQAPPSLVVRCGDVNPLPRPCAGFTDVASRSSIYFEVVVPSGNGAAHLLDPGSVTATVDGLPTGPEPALLPGGVPGGGWSVVPNGPFTDGGSTGHGYLLLRDAAWPPGAALTVTVAASTLSGLAMDPSGASWSFTTRASLAGAILSLDVDLAEPTVTWPGRWFNGILKPNFATSALFDQEPLYALIDEARSLAPDLFTHQRDWPLTSDYWSGSGYFDGNPNFVRELETRRIVAIEDDATGTRLTLADLLEGPLYGIAPGRPLSGDWAPGQRVLVCDRLKSEAATILAVDDASSTMLVETLANAASTWVLDYPGSTPADDPRTPGNFSYALGALRKLEPHGTPVYWWDRIHDEWDRHVAHGRKPIVNFDAVPFDLCRIGRPAGGYGGSCPDVPKSWTEWDDVVRAVVRHLLDRYGPDVATWRFTIGNEPDLRIFWLATQDEFASFHDHTASSILRAFEDAGLDSQAVEIGGLEMTGIFPGFVSSILHHASPTSVNPNAGFEERNHACIDPGFGARLSSRVRAICDANAQHGTPLDFVSVHAYERAAEAAGSMIDARGRALAIDPVTFADLRIMSHETTPDWVPRRDPGSRDMYRWGGYFTTWGGEYFQRLLEHGQSDPGILGGECTVTTWPFNPNFAGYASLAGQLRIDDDGDGALDRIEAVPLPFFHFATLAATMSHELRSLDVADVGGLRVSGWRSVEPDGEKILLFAHDFRDTASEEPGGIDVALCLANLRHPVVEVQEHRLDPAHPARAALEALPNRGTNGVFAPSEVAGLVAAARLAPAAPATRHESVAGALTLDVRLLAQGLVFLDLTYADSDGDGVHDGEDDCEQAWNPGQENADGDAFGDACDCAPLDPRNELPPEVTGLRLSGDTLTWDATPAATGHEILRDVAGPWRAGGGPDVACSSIGPLPTAVEPGLPGAGRAWRFLVRATNACGTGTWGWASDGIERTRACP